MSVPAAFATILVVWATTPLSIVWSNETFTPAVAISARMILAAALGWLVLKLCRIELLWHRAALRTYMFALIGLFGAMSLTYFGAHYIPSGLISILYATTPVVSSLLAYRLIGESGFNRLGWWAFAVSFFGVVLICFDNLLIDQGGWIGVLLLLGAVLLYSISGILVQREGYQAHPLSITVGALIMAVPLFLLLWLVADGVVPTVDWHSRSPWSILYLAVFGSLIGFGSYFYIINKMGATAVNMVTLATPMFALYLGSQLNGEHISMQLLLGSVFVLAGLAVYFRSLKVSSTTLRSVEG